MVYVEDHATWCKPKHLWVDPSIDSFIDFTILNVLTHCGLGDFNEILDEYFSSQLQWLMAEIPVVKLPLKCH